MDEKKVREAIKEFEIEKQTYEDVISYCKHFEPKNDCGRYEEKIAICKKAIEALEKQLPKKPIYKSGVKDNDTIYGYVGRCPSCNDIVDDSMIVCDCTQVLDWSE